MDDRGRLAGYQFGFDFGQEINLADFPACISSGAPETLCCICLEPLEKCPESMISACKWEKIPKSPVVEQTTCRNNHAAHAVCMPKLREATINKLSVPEARTIILHQKKEYMKGLKASLLTWLQNHHRAGYPLEDFLKPARCRLCTNEIMPSVCMMCTKIVEAGQATVLTKDPQCRHRFHKECVIKHGLEDGQLVKCPYRQELVKTQLLSAMRSGNDYWMRKQTHHEKQTDDEN